MKIQTIDESLGQPEGTFFKLIQKQESALALTEHYRSQILKRREQPVLVIGHTLSPELEHEILLEANRELQLRS